MHFMAIMSKNTSVEKLKLGKVLSSWHGQYSGHTVFTWLNAMATISHLCKMTAATIQGWRLLQCNQ